MNKNKKIQVPEFLKSYFWDVDFKKLDFEKSRTFILKRVLDRGNTKALRWLRQNFSNQEIKDLLLTSRDLSPKTANFWADILNINKDQVRCLQKPIVVRRSPVPLTSEYLNRPL